MLTDDDIKRIHSEEQLRHEIRKQLDAAHIAQNPPATVATPAKAQEAIEFVRELEDSEWALQSRPANQPLTDADRTQFNKLIKSCKAIHTAIDIQRSK